MYILLGFESVLLFILLGPHDPRERSRRPPNDGRRPGAAPKVPGSIFMPAIRAGKVLVSFLLSMLNFLQKRKTHLLTTKIISCLVTRARIYLYMCYHSSKISTFNSYGQAKMHCKNPINLQHLKLRT